MLTLKNGKMSFLVVFLVSLFIFFSSHMQILSALTYPMEVRIVDKNNAQYDTPENAYSTLISAMISEDREWYYNGLTTESASKEIELYQQHNFDIQQKFDSVKNIEKLYILDKKNYQNGVVLIVEIHNQDGSILQGPSIFMKEGELWKAMQDISVDDPVLDYLYYIPPLFYGKSNKPEDVNAFLGYEQPNKSQTELAIGDSGYTVHIYYGKTVDPATFEAVLNKQDISQLFSPKPFTDQEVEIPMLQGRNTLAFSIEGTRKDGKKATDNDRLVFVVP